LNAAIIHSTLTEDIMIINDYELKCFRCGHEWIRRHKKLPKTCPLCRATTWNKQERTNRCGYKDGRTNTVWIERLQETNDLKKDE
jgi:late competence protein required for DNA uptake (superfamily II DNA/RNA helicase)